MKYLKMFSKFQENLENEDPDIKMSNEKIEKLKKQIDEYKQKKSIIDSIYKKYTNSKDIQDNLEKILGKTDIQNGIDRNPFLVDYTSVVKLQWNIEKEQNDNITDKIKLDDFKQDLAISKSDDKKKMLNQKILDINKRMSERVSKVNNLKNEYTQKKKKHDDDMNKILNDIKQK